MKDLNKLIEKFFQRAVVKHPEIKPFLGDLYFITATTLKDTNEANLRKFLEENIQNIQNIKKGDGYNHRVNGWKVVLPHIDEYVENADESPFHTFEPLKKPSHSPLEEDLNTKYRKDADRFADELLEAVSDQIDGSDIKHLAIQIAHVTIVELYFFDDFDDDYFKFFLYLIGIPTNYLYDPLEVSEKKKLFSEAMKKLEKTPLFQELKEKEEEIKSYVWGADAVKELTSRILEQLENAIYDPEGSPTPLGEDGKRVREHVRRWVKRHLEIQRKHCKYMKPIHFLTFYWLVQDTEEQEIAKDTKFLQRLGENTDAIVDKILERYRYTIETYTKMIEDGVFDLEKSDEK